MPLAGHDPARCPRKRARRDFNPHAPCGARPCQARLLARLWIISIHMPLAGHDGEAICHPYVNFLFQSTCPLRGTTKVELGYPTAEDISIHMPLAGHDGLNTAANSAAIDFNPHAPCGARPWRPYTSAIPETFQSTCPLRGTTLEWWADHHWERDISIHMPLAGHDTINRILSTPFCISIHMPLAGHDCKKAQRLLCIFVKTG